MCFSPVVVVLLIATVVGLYWKLVGVFSIHTNPPFAAAPARYPSAVRASEA
jgi:hypothetical protein